MVRINLIPVRQVKKREVGRQQLFAFGFLIVLGFAGDYLLVKYFQDRVDAQQMTIDKRKSQIAQLEVIIGEVNQITAERKDLEDKLKILDTLKKKRGGPVKVMDSLAQLMPAHAWITSLSERGGSVEMAGLGMTNDDVAELMRELKKSQYFSNIVLKRVTSEQVQGPVTQVVHFEISCNVTYSV